MLQAQGTNSAAFLRDEDQHIAAEKRDDALCDEYLKDIQQAAKAIAALPGGVCVEVYVEAVVEDLAHAEDAEWYHDTLTEWVASEMKEAA